MFDEVNSIMSFECRVVTWGCGCNKSSQAPSAGASSARRMTVYQVLSNGAVISEFSTLPDARAAATAANGRVKVSSKVV